MKREAPSRSAPGIMRRGSDARLSADAVQAEVDADARLPRRQWLQKIRTRRDDGQRDLARESGQSLAAINAIVSRGEWPKRRTAAVRASVVDALRNAGATTAELREVSLDDSKEKAPSAPTPEACCDAVAPQLFSAPAEVNQNPTEKEEGMLLQNTPITPQALKHFKLPRSPFVDDVQSRDDVYQSPAVRYARAALLDVAQNHGFFGADRTWQQRQNHLPAHGPLGVFIVGFAFLTPDPGVHQHIPRPGIIATHGLVRDQHREIRDTANIQHHTPLNGMGE